MSHNPFDDSQGNPWSNGGPKYGNAYENAPPELPPRAYETPTLAPSSPYTSQRMPSPSAYQPQPTVNAWQQESTKTLDESAYNTNAYQYSGTPYGNSPTVSNAYSPQPVFAENTTNNDINTSNTKAESITPPSAVRTHPSKLRAMFRIILFVLAVGYLGFSAGASPFSGEPIPFDSKICFYYLYVVGSMSIIWSGYHAFLYLFRRFGSAEKINRFILILCDLFMAALWGIGVIVEVIQFRCSPGDHNHWCDFYNTSIFFGFASFAMYIFLVGWDFFGCCKSRR